MSGAKRGTVCAAFQWIGQAFDVCDGCGHPLWEHSHDSVHADGKPIGHSRHRIISVASAAGARRNWERHTPEQYRCECYDGPIVPAHVRLAS